MGALLTAIEELVTWFDAEAKLIHDRLRNRLFILIAIMLLAIIFNLADYGGINFALMLIVSVAAVIVGTEHRFLLVVTGLGALNKIASPKEGAKDGLNLAKDAIVGIMLIVNLFLFFAGWLEFGNNPTGIVVVLAGAVLLFWMDLAWNIKTKFIKPISYSCTVVIVLIHAGMFIPKTFWQKTIGFDPYHSIQYTEAEKALAEVDGESAKTFDQKLADEIREIAKRKKEKKSLPGDTKRDVEIRKIMNEATVANQAGIAVKGALEAAKKSIEALAPKKAEAGTTSALESSKGWVVKGNELFVDIEAGDYAERPFTLTNGNPTPVIVVPAYPSYIYHVTNLQPVYVDDGTGEVLVNPEDNYEPPDRQGVIRLRYRPANGYAQLIFRIDRIR